MSKRIEFVDLAQFCEFMRRIGGATSVFVSSPDHPSVGGRYVSFQIRPRGPMTLGEGRMSFSPEMPYGTMPVSGGPFAFTEDMLRAIARAGVTPNDYGPHELTTELADIAKAARAAAPGMTAESALDGLVYTTADR